MSNLFKSLFTGKNKADEVRYDQIDEFATTLPLSSVHTGIEVEELTFEQYLLLMKKQERKAQNLA